MSDQNLSEELDADKIEGDYPPEQPLGADEYGTTPAEEAWDEPLEERIAREEPDVPAPDVDAALAAVEPDPLAEYDDSVQEHEGPAPAEEAALHVEEQ